MTYKGFEIYAVCTVSQIWDITDDGFPDSYIDQTDDAPKVHHYEIEDDGSTLARRKTFELAKQHIDTVVALRAA